MNEGHSILDNGIFSTVILNAADENVIVYILLLREYRHYQIKSRIKINYD